MEMTKINKSEFTYLQKKQKDNVGEVFEWKGRVFRGVFQEKVSLVKDLFDSGFIPELIKEGLFPETRITEFKNDDYGLIFEHKKIWPVIYPQEWSFSMLKDSALLVLRIAQAAREYGYNMKDCHGLNILFEDNKPKFIDLGSFSPDKDGCTGWRPFEEFLRSYYYPLYTWKDGLVYASKLSIFSGNLTPHLEHYIYRHRFLKYFNSSFLDKFIKFSFLFTRLASMDTLSLNNRMLNKKYLIRKAAIAAKHLINTGRFLINQDLNRLEKRVRKISRREINSEWSHYNLKMAHKKLRFEKIIQYINSYCSDAVTAVDIAGNQGVFSRQVLNQTGIRQIICQDLDEQAIDSGYRSVRQAKDKICFVNYNFMAPVVNLARALPSERFRSDIAFALRLSHHLILTQGFGLDDVLEELGKYSKKYVIIEFMPKGVWVKGAQVDVPEWYSREWFQEGFKKYFTILKEEQIADNCVIFIGQKRD